MPEIAAQEQDVFEFNNENQEEQTFTPDLARNINTDQKDLSFFEINRQIERGDIILDPDFQRHYVWEKKNESLLIESILLKLPLPMIYLAEIEDGKKVIIDGQQRLTAIYKFFQNEFPLKELTVFTQFKGKYFRDLPVDAQNIIEDGTIRSVTFLHGCDPELKFQVFMRLNSGAMALNAMELRNCLYRGPYMQLIKELADYPDFINSANPQDQKNFHKRMNDWELVLRFCALYHNGHNYTSPTKRFLNKDAQQWQNIAASDADELRKAFKTAINCVYSIFGPNSFRKFVKGDQDNPNGKWYNQLNVGVYEAMLYAFRNADKNAVMRAKDELREALIELMTNDKEYARSIDKATGNQASVLYRLRKTEDLVGQILQNYPRQPRCFSREIKEQLFARNQICAICGTKIEAIDDAHVDHIEQYHNGGETTIDNARLTHRFCNQSRPRNEE